MAQVTAQHTRYPSMEIALTQGSLAWTADGVQLPAMRRCSEIFASLFEEPKGASPLNGRPYAAKPASLMTTSQKCDGLSRRSERPTKTPRPIPHLSS